MRITKYICVILFSFIIFTNTNAQTEKPKTALIIIDIQYFYFPGGDAVLVKPEEASLNAKKVLEHFRSTGQLVVHVKHNYEPEGGIHENVKPAEGEKVITKNEVNSFKDTDLLSFLKENKIERVVICGMQTHMCIEAASRAASDYGFKTVVIGDACATKDLKYKDKVVKAEDVHNSTLSTLNRTYATIFDAEAFIIEDLQNKK